MAATRASASANPLAAVRKHMVAAGAPQSIGAIWEGVKVRRALPSFLFAAPGRPPPASNGDSPLPNPNALAEQSAEAFAGHSKTYLRTKILPELEARNEVRPPSPPRPPREGSVPLPTAGTGRANAPDWTMGVRRGDPAGAAAPRSPPFARSLSVAQIAKAVLHPTHHHAHETDTVGTRFRFRLNLNQRTRRLIARDTKESAPAPADR